MESIQFEKIHIPQDKLFKVIFSFSMCLVSSPMVFMNLSANILELCECVFISSILNVNLFQT